MASSQESRIPVYDNSEGSEPTKENADGSVAMAVSLTSEQSSTHRSTRKFFQDSVHEAVRRARYGQWDFDFSKSTCSAEEITTPLWGPVSAKEIFTGILRPNHPDWKYTRNENGGSPRTPPGMGAYAE